MIPAHDRAPFSIGACVMLENLFIELISDESPRETLTVNKQTANTLRVEAVFLNTPHGAAHHS